MSARQAPPELVEATPAAAATNRLVVLVGSVEPTNEGTSDVIFKLSLSAPAPRPVVVVYSTIGGTVGEGEDYQSASGVLTITWQPECRNPDLAH